MNNKKRIIFFRHPILPGFLLACGVLSSIWYLVINIIVPLQYDGYSILSQTVSELSAIDTPTRDLWTFLCVFYTLLLIAFGCGIALIPNVNMKLMLAAMIIIFDAVFGFFWPPMHQRQVIAAGGGTLTDTLHIVWTIIHVVLMLIVIVLAAATLGKGFRIYSFITVLTFLVFGILTTMESQGIESGASTPYIGVWERINMASYMLWLAVLAIILLGRQQKSSLMTANV
jgi:hypothetical protein